MIDNTSNQHPVVVACAALLAACLLAGCPRGKGAALAKLADRTDLAEKPRILARSEVSPLGAAAVHDDKIYAATATGLLVFSRDEGTFNEIVRMEGVDDEYKWGNRGEPITEVLGVSADDETGVWFARKQGIVQYKDGKWNRHEYHPLVRLPVTRLLAIKDDVWFGASRNLALWRNGWWSGFLEGTHVSYLLEDRKNGGVWVGTLGKGVYRNDQRTGKFVQQVAEHGQRVVDVRSLTYNEEFGVMAAGSGGDHDWVAFFDGKVWTSYRVEPPGKVGWVQQVGKQTLMAYENRVMRLLRQPPEEIQKAKKEPKEPADTDLVPEETPGQARVRETSRKVVLRQGPVRLVAEPSPAAPLGYATHHFYTEATNIWLPTDATDVVAYDDFMLFSTEALGVGLFDGKRTTWYRRNDLVGDNGRLRMACVGRQCYLPGDHGKAYRFTDDEFDRVSLGLGKGERAEGFFNGENGDLFGLFSTANGKVLVVARHDGKRLIPISVNFISMKKGRLEVRFVRLNPALGELWVGLWDVDEKGARTPWGVVVLRPPLPRSEHESPEGIVLPGWVTADELPDKPQQPAAEQGIVSEAPMHFHRSTLLPEEDRPPHSLALPDDIRDVWFQHGAAWVATGAGVIRVVGNTVEPFTENEGLPEEVVYAVTVGPDDQPLAATLGGLGRYDGADWRFDFGKPLNGPCRALLYRGGILWVATAHGVVRKQRRRHWVYGENGGYVTGNVVDLHMDAFNRLWVLSDQGLSILFF